MENREKIIRELLSVEGSKCVEVDKDNALIIIDLGGVKEMFPVTKEELTKCGRADMV